jgi:ATP-dependent helicase HrpB
MARAFAALMDGAPVIESQGRSHPITLVHLGRGPERRIEDEMAGAVRRALAETEGSLLAFLPGVAEIERTAERLTALPPDTDLHRLHGTLDPAEQRAAIRAAPNGRRKIVLATSIAETSLTLDGVRVVVDSGLARRPRYDRGAGITRLVTERASQAAVTQRAGRAGRQAPGTVYRLWEEAATASLPRFDPPEILEADLSALLLDCALWGVADPRTLRWLDPPPAAAVEEARGRLVELGAIDEAGRPTAHGRAMAALPLPPRLAHMLIEAETRGWGETAAQVAVLLSERGLGGNDADLDLRLRRWRSERSKRAEAARGLTRRWRQLLRRPDSHVSSDVEKRVSASLDTSGSADTGKCIALAFPDRVSKRRDASGENWISAGGRGFRLDPASPLAREPWLAVAEVSGTAAGARILSAAPLAETDVERLFADRIRDQADLSFDPRTGMVRARRGRRLGAINSARGATRRPRKAEVEAALLDGVRAHGLGPAALERGRRQSPPPRRLRPPLRSFAAGPFGRGADGRARRVASAASHRQAAPVRHRARRAFRNAGRTARLSGRARSRSPCSRQLRRAGGEQSRDRLPGRGGSDRHRARAGAVRADRPSGRSGRAGTARAGADLPRGTADPDDARPARLLGGKLGRRRQGDARPLSKASLAR